MCWSLVDKLATRDVKSCQLNLRQQRCCSLRPLCDGGNIQTESFFRHQSSICLCFVECPHKIPSTVTHLKWLLPECSTTTKKHVLFFLQWTVCSSSPTFVQSRTLEVVTPAPPAHPSTPKHTAGWGPKWQSSQPDPWWPRKVVKNDSMWCCLRHS